MIKKVIKDLGSDRALQFKVSLNHVRPVVWRRIQVPESYTFWGLHCAIQNAMGWSNSHLHAFSLSEKRSMVTRIQMPNPGWDSKSHLDESNALLSSWFPNRVKQCVYTYDFGDSWDHTVLFERSIPAEKKGSYPRCVAGENAGPPEDCGGVSGYEDLLSVINLVDDPRGEELRTWLGLEKGEKYDPTTFDIDDIAFNNEKILLKEYLHDQEMYA